MLKNKKILTRMIVCCFLVVFNSFKSFSEADLSSGASLSGDSPLGGELSKDLSSAAELIDKQTVDSKLPNEKVADVIKKIKAPLSSQQEATIAVEVNKDVITNGDVEKRLGLILISSNQSVEDMDEKAIDDIIQQIKEALIQEKLQRQIAAHLKIVVLKAELDQAITGIAKENNMTLDELASFFKSKGVDIKTLRDRVESNILWIKSVREGIAFFANITDREVKNEVRRLKQNEDKEQFEIAEIVLFVNSPEKLSRIANEAANLHHQLVAGTPFASLARNFSESPSGAQGGLVGWVTKEQLPDEVTKVPVGRFSKPVLRDNRYIIYFVKDHKLPGQAAASEAKMSYVDVKVMVQPEMSQDDQARIGGFLENISIVEGCSALKQSAKSSGLDVEEVTDVSVALVPDGIRKLFAVSGKGKATEPVRLSETELRVFMLCGQKAPAKKVEPTENEIRAMLKEKRVQEQAMTQFNKFKAQATIMYRTPR